MNKIFAPFLPPWVETGLQPAFYDRESGTVLQQTARMYAKVQQLTRLFNELSQETKTTVEEYIEKFVELKDYVDEYFENLDVQEEINNKLDAMAEDGSLARVMGQAIQTVSYKCFGAALDGVTDDTDAIIAAHEYANEHGCKVVQKSGIVYMPSADIDNCPIVNTDCDLSGCTFKFDEESDNKTVFIIADPDSLESDKDVKSIELSPAQISSLSKTGSNSIAFLDDYRNHHVIFDTDMKIGKRRFAGQEDIYYAQSFEVNDLSQLTPNNMYADIATNASEVVMRYLPLDQHHITIKMPKIVITGDIVNNPRILVERNNISLEDAIIVKEPSNQTTAYSQALIDCRYCANIDVRNFVGENISVEASATDTTSYIIRFDRCYNVLFEHNNLIKGHGCFVSYHCNFINFVNNTTDRFDAHYGMFGGVNVTNNNFTSRPAMVNLAYGDGNVTIKNNTFYKYPENGIYSQYAVDNRTDLTVMYAGSVTIEDNYIKALHTDGSKYATLFGYIPSHGTGSIYPTFGNYNYPTVTIKNNTIEGNTLKRTVETYNNNAADQTYVLQPWYISNNNKFANTSIIQISGVTVPDGVFITLNNERANVSDGGEQVLWCLESANRIAFTASTSIVQVIGRGNYISGTVKNLRLYGAIEAASATLTVTNLYSTGYFDMDTINVTSGYASNYFKFKTLNVTTELHLTGAFIDAATAVNNSGTIYMAGCQMSGGSAGRFTTGISGNGNWGGTNSGNLNTLS